MLIFLGNVIINKNIILIIVVLLMAAPAHAHLFSSDFEANTEGVNVTTEQIDIWNWWNQDSTSAVSYNTGVDHGT